MEKFAISNQKTIIIYSKKRRLVIGLIIWMILAMLRDRIGLFSEFTTHCVGVGGLKYEGIVGHGTSRGFCCSNVSQNIVEWNVRVYVGTFDPTTASEVI